MGRLLATLFLTGFLGGVALCYARIDFVTRQFALLRRTAVRRYLGGNQRDGVTERARHPFSPE
jgi:hypothetical protein